MARPTTAALQTFLDSWAPDAEGVQIADLYTLTLATGEIFRYSGFQTAIFSELPDGQLTTNTSTSAGSNTLGFSSLPPWVIDGLTVSDLTASTVIPPNTTITSITSNTITLSNNVTGAGVGSGDTISFGANFDLGPAFNRTRTKIEIGTKVGELEVDIFAGVDDTLGTFTWQNACVLGLLDGAYIELDRCFMSPPGTVIGSIGWFYGRVGEIDIGRTRIIIRVKSLMDLMTVQMPKRFYQAQCPFVFGGPLCLFDRTTMQSTISALSTSTQYQIDTGLLPSSFPSTPLSTPSPSTLYDQGTIIGTSGANAGYTRTIGSMVAGVIYQLWPWFYPVMPGDDFTLLPGCDHSLPTCEDVFDNIIHYGGEPYIPPPENAV